MGWLIYTSWLTVQVVGLKDSVHAVAKPRRARRTRSQFQNFTGSYPVTEIPLSKYGWMEVEDTITGLLEAALGPEVAYWKSRGITCDDIAHTVGELHSMYDAVRENQNFLHSLRVVIIYNQTWHFLDPVQCSGGNGSDGAGGPEGRGGSTPQPSRFDWPLLAPNSPDVCSSPCQAQLKLIHQAIASRLEGWRSRRPPAYLQPPRYRLPDMVFVINAADNMQRFGYNSRAPVLSLMKWWQVPWTELQERQQQEDKQQQEEQKQKQQAVSRADSEGDASTRGNSSTGGPAASLGRLGGKLLKPLQLPYNVARLAASAGKNGSSCSVKRTEALVARPAAVPEVGKPDPLWDMVRRFVAETSLDLPPGVQAEHVDRKKSPRRHYDMDLLLPTVAYAPRSLSYFPWEQKKDVAFFSGSAFCPLYPDLHPICPRVLLANVSAAGWFRSDLDVRLVRPFRGRLGSQGPYKRDVSLKKASEDLQGEGPGRKAGSKRNKTKCEQEARDQEGRGPALATAPRDHARYRYLLHMDGLAGSTRLGMLMATDSVILKSRSPYIEYYSRLQVPGVHYLEFWKDPHDPLDVLRVLAEARAAAASDPEGMRAAVQANQAIAARYIAMEPKLPSSTSYACQSLHPRVFPAMLHAPSYSRHNAITDLCSRRGSHAQPSQPFPIYARAALLTYHSLVPDMESCVSDLIQHLQRPIQTVGMSLPGQFDTPTGQFRLSECPCQANSTPRQANSRLVPAI
ncbi:hypothetical protein VOLCADRAFT_98550 [Volvox carteri f. nagariensis]|uniref:Glycosyl transferase CAP10 domain-containing protein n=1 Tax=Volvox carteri f. nagariensis TaxID=3068 RepID=D8UFM8_VOLCA|nr:uncharacterized protein VOLCADRAFT_98550 [Volvox carteri f. nagariensis]EFJ41531.1 hypothetical protein VOLCADRAFT_98550 [Volvox carteri f. nagariensis]|eukprot:XP_002957476.1 hypothetical protein VOLCADRAFT_98550 [Volvox carteri f. nagariensis]